MATLSFSGRNELKLRLGFWSGGHMNAHCIILQRQYYSTVSLMLILYTTNKTLEIKVSFYLTIRLVVGHFKVLVVILFGIYSNTADLKINISLIRLLHQIYHVMTGEYYICLKNSIYVVTLSFTWALLLHNLFLQRIVIMNLQYFYWFRLDSISPHMFV